MQSSTSSLQIHKSAGNSLVLKPSTVDICQIIHVTTPKSPKFDHNFASTNSVKVFYGSVTLFRGTGNSFISCPLTFMDNSVSMDGSRRIYCIVLIHLFLFIHMTMVCCFLKKFFLKSVEYISIETKGHSSAY